MKKNPNRFLSVLLAVMLVFSLLPASVFAANDETVLTSISHSSALSPVSLTGKTTATLTVPYGYAGTTLDLSKGLDLAYNTATYFSIEKDFPDGFDATIDGSSVRMIVSYIYAADQTAADSAGTTPTKYNTTYTLSVVKAAYKAPTFSGSITKSLSGTGTISFTGTDFSSKYTQNDGNALGYISISGGNPSYGALKFNGSDYVFDTPMNIADLNAGKLTFVATGTSNIPVSYTATAFDSGSSPQGSSVTVRITVSTAAPSNINWTTKEETALAFTAADFNTVCRAVTGDDLSYVQFTLPSASQGTLYTGYVSTASKGTAVSASDKYYYSAGSPLLSSVTLLPYTDFYGTCTINYNAFTTDGDTYAGKVVVTVTDVVDATIADIKYTADEDETVTFSRTDFNKVCSDYTKSSLKYVKFTLPKTSYGVLYYDYTSSTKYDDKVTTSDKYYYSSDPYIAKVAFVPKSGYSGTVSLSYTAYPASGSSYTGTVKITIGGSGSSDVDLISYKTKINTAFVFDEDDFNEVCEDEQKEELKYVKFTLPSASAGRLYYNYTSSSKYDSKVSASTKYYCEGSPNIGKVAFVPASDYEGTCNINYTGVDDDGESFSGKVKIVVGSGTSSGDYISYTTEKNKTLTLDDDDFIDKCEDENDEDLNYVKFSLPSSSTGTLYYDYSSSSSNATKVSASTKYYVSKASYLKKVSFVPATDYTGTVTISYTGYDDDGDDFSGKIKIIVGGTSGSASDISYSTNQNTAFTLKSSDFESVCKKVNGENLDSIKFTLPSSAYGILYTGYTSSESYTSKVASATKYYVSSAPKISSISFVPAKDYTGTATISYTGYDDEGDSFTGKINVTVKSTTVTPTVPVVPTVPTSSSAYFSDINSNYTWAVASIDALYKAGYITGTGNKKFNPAAKITRGDFILMLYRSLGLKSTNATSNFSDVAKESYYYEAIAVAKALGIAKGENGKFDPKETLTRQDAMVLVNRALAASGTVLTAGNSNDLKAFKDSSNISGYAYNSVATLVKAGIVNGSASKINPQSTVSRAEIAVILKRVIK